MWIPDDKRIVARAKTLAASKALHCGLCETSTRRVPQGGTVHDGRGHRMDELVQREDHRHHKIEALASQHKLKCMHFLFCYIFLLMSCAGFDLNFKL